MSLTRGTFREYVCPLTVAQAEVFHTAVHQNDPTSVLSYVLVDNFLADGTVATSGAQVILLRTLYVVALYVPHNISFPFELTDTKRTFSIAHILHMFRAYMFLHEVEGPNTVGLESQVTAVKGIVLAYFTISHF